MASPSPVTQFETTLKDSAFVYLVYYRGRFCPFCMSWLNDLSKITSSIEAAGGKVLVVTADSETNLAATRTASGYTGEVIIDQKHELATELKKKGWLDVAITKRSGFPNGMAQPGVLVITKEEDVLFSWAIVPALMNMGGAKDRPSLSQIWDDADAKMKGKPRVHQSYSTQSFFGVMSKKIMGN